MIRKTFRLTESQADDDYNAGYAAAIKAYKDKMAGKTGGASILDIDDDSVSDISDIDDAKRELEGAKDSLVDENGEQDEQAKDKAKELSDAIDEANKIIDEIANGEDASSKAKEFQEKAKELLDKIDPDRKNRASKSDSAIKDEETHDKDQDAKANAQRIKDFIADKGNLEDAEREVTLNNEKQYNKERADLAKKYFNQNTPLKFLTSLNRLIKTQVGFHRERTWRRPSKNTVAGSDVIRKGRARVEAKVVPLIAIYYDRSGSWKQDPSKTKVGDEAISMLRQNYEKKGLIKIELMYFGDEVSANPDATGSGGTGACQLILNDIQARKATNVIILTDSDMDYYQDGSNKFTKKVTIPGGVYFLFKGGVCKSIQQYLRGQTLTEAYTL